MNPLEEPRRQLVFEEPDPRRSDTSMTTSNLGEENFVIKFELLTTDEFHEIWETSDKYVQRQEQAETQKAEKEAKIRELKKILR